MELRTQEGDALEEYGRYYHPLLGDERTRRAFNGILKGIIASESLCCSRIAVFSPELNASEHGERRVRRLVHGESSKRSELDDRRLVERLQMRAVELLAGEREVWVMVDGSDLRKPEAQRMEGLMKVRSLKGSGLVAGYRTLNAIGVSPGKRGLLYHRLFSSQSADFESESREVEHLLNSVGRSLAGSQAVITYVLDRGFDDIAVWGVIGGQGHHLVCRLSHLGRLVQQVDDTGQRRELSVREAAQRLVAQGTVEADMRVRKRGQRQAHRQTVTVELAACELQVNAAQGVMRLRGDKMVGWQKVWLVRVTLPETTYEPWWLLTDWPVRDEAAAKRIFQMYYQRWAVEDGFKFIKQCLGWESVQVLSLAGVRLLVALAWVAAGFLYELGVTWEWVEVQLLARLGGWPPRSDRPPGKQVIARGLRRLLDIIAAEAILNDHIATYGRLPPRIATILGRN